MANNEYQANWLERNTARPDFIKNLYVLQSGSANGSGNFTFNPVEANWLTITSGVNNIINLVQPSPSVQLEYNTIVIAPDLFTTVIATNGGNIKLLGGATSISLNGSQREWISVRWDPASSKYIQVGGKTAIPPNVIVLSVSAAQALMGSGGVVIGQLYLIQNIMSPFVSANILVMGLSSSAFEEQGQGDIFNPIMTQSVNATIWYNVNSDTIKRVYESVYNNDVWTGVFTSSVTVFPFDGGLGASCYDNVFIDVDLQNVTSQDMVWQGSHLETLILDAQNATDFQMIGHYHVGEYGNNGKEIAMDTGSTPSSPYLYNNNISHGRIINMTSGCQVTGNTMGYLSVIDFQASNSCLITKCNIGSENLISFSGNSATYAGLTIGTENQLDIGTSSSYNNSTFVNSVVIIQPSDHWNINFSTLDSMIINGNSQPYFTYTNNVQKGNSGNGTPSGYEINLSGDHITFDGNTINGGIDSANGNPTYFENVGTGSGFYSNMIEAGVAFELSSHVTQMVKNTFYSGSFNQGTLISLSDDQDFSGNIFTNGVQVIVNGQGGAPISGNTVGQDNLITIIGALFTGNTVDRNASPGSGGISVYHDITNCKFGITSHISTLNGGLDGCSVGDNLTLNAPLETIQAHVNQHWISEGENSFLAILDTGIYVSGTTVTIPDYLGIIIFTSGSSPITIDSFVMLSGGAPLNYQKYQFRADNTVDVAFNDSGGAFFFPYTLLPSNQFEIFGQSASLPGALLDYVDFQFNPDAAAFQFTNGNNY